MTYKVKEAKTKPELDAILLLRYEILRKPWAQPAATATDDLEATSINAYITDENGKAIACGRLQENANKVGQVRYMAVDNNYQGQGLGKMIIEFLEDKARSMQLNSVELQARENAVPFYESCGYSIKEKSFLLWGIIQHFLMQKKTLSKN
ncbi:MAG: GNAT family N-acetyltransferase [Bacteroidia bacterium]